MKTSLTYWEAKMRRLVGDELLEVSYAPKGVSVFVRSEAAAEKIRGRLLGRSGRGVGTLYDGVTTEPLGYSVFIETGTWNVCPPYATPLPALPR